MTTTVTTLLLIISAFFASCDSARKSNDSPPTPDNFEQGGTVDFDPLVVGHFESSCQPLTDTKIFDGDVGLREFVSVSVLGELKHRVVLWSGLECNGHQLLEISLFVNRLSGQGAADSQAGRETYRGRAETLNLKILQDAGLSRRFNRFSVCGYQGWQTRKSTDLLGRRCFGLDKYPLRGDSFTFQGEVDETGLKMWFPLGPSLADKKPLLRTSPIFSGERRRQEVEPRSAPPTEHREPGGRGTATKVPSGDGKDPLRMIAGTWQVCERQQALSRSALKTLHFEEGPDYLFE